MLCCGGYRGSSNRSPSLGVVRLSVLLVLFFNLGRVVSSTLDGKAGGPEPAEFLLDGRGMLGPSTPLESSWRRVESKTSEKEDIFRSCDNEDIVRRVEREKRGQF